MKNTNEFVEKSKDFLRIIESIKKREYNDISLLIKKNNEYHNVISHIEKYRKQYYEECLPFLKLGRVVGNNLLISLELYAYKCLNENCITLHKYCMYTRDRLYSKDEIEKILLNGGFENENV